MILKASEGGNFMRIELPRSDICNKNSKRAFSSDEVRYCWFQAVRAHDGVE